LRQDVGRHDTYLYCFRLLLERMSWLAKARGGVVEYTLSHVRRFRIAKLREYEQ